MLLGVVGVVSVVELEVVPWLSSMLLAAFTLVLLAGRLGKDHPFTPEYHPVNEGDDLGWFFGVFVLFVSYLDAIAWVLKEARDPGSIAASGVILYNCAVAAGGAYLVLPYLLTVTRLRLVEESAVLFCFAALPFIPWADWGKVPAGFVPVVVVACVLLAFRAATVASYFAGRFRDQVLGLVRELAPGLKRKLCSARATAAVACLEVVLAYLANANVLLF
ncbi:MAG: hypothetical protein ACTSU5_11690 [Promethearchaeota archaeon]